MPDGVETEALRLAIHHPDIAATYLDESLFFHPTVRAAFVALQAPPSVGEAIERRRPRRWRRCCAGWSVETSEAEWTDVLSRLATEVGRTVLVDLEAEARVAEDPLVLQRLDRLAEGDAGPACAARTPRWKRWTSC